MARVATFPEPGDEFDSFKILGRLGAGAMGEVYRAHDRVLGRDVALKLLPPEFADDPERRLRLFREARSAASLNHPNICTIHQIGAIRDRVFIAMELVEGVALSTRVAEGPLSSDAVVRTGFQLADALSHAHDRGVVHRDLKSANVMITPEGRVKVVDFGLSKRIRGEILDGVTTTDASLTRHGAIVGTLGYMAPEQLRGQAADARSDVWALGVVLYEMATGARPFDGQTGFEVSSAILHNEPPALPAHVPPQLQNVIRRCLEKEPARRYQQASEARAALEALGADAGARNAVASRSARRPTSAVAGIAVLALVIGAALWWNVGLLREHLFPTSHGAIQSIAVLPLENLSGDPEHAYLAAGMHEALITDLARFGVSRVIAKPSTDVLKGTRKSLRDIGRELGVEGLVTGSIMRANDRVQVTAQLVRAESGEVLWANRYDRSAGDMLSLQSDIAAAIGREVRGVITPEQRSRLATARPIDPAAHDAYLKGRFFYVNFSNSNDKKQLDAAISEFERAIRIDPGYAPAYAALSAAQVAQSGAGFLPPGDTFPKARAAALKAVELDDALPEGHAALASVLLWFDWNWAGAEREIQRALQLNPTSVDALATYEAHAVLVEGDVDQAVRTSREILSLDPLNPFSRMQAGWVTFNARQHDASIQAVKNLIDLYPDHVWGHFFLAMNYGAKQMRGQVITECGTVMKLLSGHYGMQPIGLCAWALGVVGQRDQARRLLQTLEHPPQGLWLDPTIIGCAYAAIGDIDRAIEWFNTGMRDRAPTMIYMKASAVWDAARADPRFQGLLRQMNFPG